MLQIFREMGKIHWAIRCKKTLIYSGLWFRRYHTANSLHVLEDVILHGHVNKVNLISACINMLYNRIKILF